MCSSKDSCGEQLLAAWRSPSRCEAHPYLLL